MLHTYSLGKAYLGSGWGIHPLSGSLFCTPTDFISRFQSKNLPTVVKDALNKCNEPYELRAPQANTINSSINQKSLLLIERYFRRVEQLHKLNFFISVGYASLSKNICEDTMTAMRLLNSLGEEMHDACLAKCLTAAKCSASFKSKGVIFIGAHLPLKAMHAWIIEDDYQPDETDRQWVNFVPLLALSHF